MAVAALVARKATGKHLIAIDMNQGGIGSFKVFGSFKTEAGEALFITHNGLERLQQIK